MMRSSAAAESRIGSLNMDLSKGDEIAPANLTHWRGSGGSGDSNAHETPGDIYVSEAPCALPRFLIFVNSCPQQPWRWA